MSAWIEQVEYRLDEANELEATDLVPGTVDHRPIWKAQGGFDP
jgi:hypothetical protein